MDNSVLITAVVTLKNNIHVQELPFSRSGKDEQEILRKAARDRADIVAKYDLVSGSNTTSKVHVEKC